MKRQPKLKVNKLDVWLIAGWVIFITFVVTDMILLTRGFYVSTTLEILIGTVFGAFETVCCTVIKTNESQASYKFELERVKLQLEYDQKVESHKLDKTEPDIEDDGFNDTSVDGDRGF